MYGNTILLSVVFVAAVAGECFSQATPVFMSALEARHDEYPQLRVSWASEHFQNTRERQSEDDPFATDSEISEDSSLKILRSLENVWYIKQNDMGFKHGLVVLAQGAYRLLPLEYSCIASEVRQKDITNAAGSIRLGLDALDCPDYEYQALALLYRPELSEFFRLLKQGEFVPVPGQTVWSGRAAYVFSHRGGVVQTEYFFDAVLTGVYLGCRSRGPGDNYTVEVSPKIVEDRIAIDSIVLTVRAASTNKLVSKSVCNDFRFDFENEISLREMMVTFDPGMHISRKEIGSEYEEFICREDGSLEPLTDANRER